MRTIHLDLNNPYEILIEDNLLESNRVSEFCKKISHRVVLIADENVPKGYREKLLADFKLRDIKAELLLFKANEKNKSRKIKEKLEDQMIKMGCGRDTCIIALGGGITTDLAGFIAATYYRGIPAVYVPTTLLSMVDASIGGKTGVNTSFGKNLIGAFYQPRAVFIDTSVLNSLPSSEFKNGLVEMIKHAIIADENYFSNLNGKFNLEEAIAKSCEIKKSIVEQDEKDMGIRQLLNFGHTIGHALESASNYSLRHGEAVALGIIAESYISLKLGLLSQSAYDKIRAIFETHDITVKLKKLDKKTVKNALLMDKKNVEQTPRFVLIKDIGVPHRSTTGYTSGVPEDIINEGLDILC